MKIHPMITRSAFSYLSATDKAVADAAYALLLLKHSLPPRLERKKQKRMKINIEASEMETNNLKIKQLIPILPPGRYALAFDTETTGLFPEINPKVDADSEPDNKKRKREKINPLIIPTDLLEKCPYITQFSLIVYNIENNKIAYSFDSYIQIPQNVEIQEHITKLSGATREKCDAGMRIEDVLGLFYKVSAQCEYIIGHNIEFDKNMVLLELIRNEENIEDSESMYNMFDMRIRCSMKSSQNLYGLKKAPRLSELHEMMFQEKAESYGIPLHNSLVDTLVCLRCSLKVFCNIYMSKTEFLEAIKEVGIV
jgi:DNA polymerase III epsilon subunit-like protein